MKLSNQLLSLFKGNEKVISITGAGGKTSLLILLAAAYKAQGKSVLLTTTTKIQSPKLFNFGQDRYFLNETEALSYFPIKGEVVFYSELHLMDPKKCIAPRLEVLSILAKRYDVVLVEADGAKRLPLKVHTERDPVIIDETTASLAVMGASSLGLKGDNVCFGLDSPLTVDFDFFQHLINAEEGALKGLTGKKVLLINQVDLLSLEKLQNLKQLQLPEDVTLILGSVVKDESYV